MVYRIKYIFNGTRDKGIEITDYYGDYKKYQLIQANCEENGVGLVEPTERVGCDIEYMMQMNQRNHKERKLYKENEINDEDLILEAECPKYEEFGIAGGEWVDENEPKVEDESVFLSEGRERPIVGTEMANFLNFDVDRFINGGYSFVWSYKVGEERDKIVGLKKVKEHNLNDLSKREYVSSIMIHGSMEENETERIPFFIRMFGCKFINTETWEYDIQEVENIKAVQEKFKDFCEKVFFPTYDGDKRTNFERYCEKIDKIEKKELRKRVPKEWFSPSSLEEALYYECYAMIKGNVNFYKCENCGLYSVGNDNRSRLCSRKIYDGTIYERNTRKEHYYICKEEQYLKTTREKISSNFITCITDMEKKRLYSHIGTYSKLMDIQDRLVIKFGDIVYENEESYRKMIEGKDEGTIVQIANDYLNLIIDTMNAFITETIGIAMNDKFLFTRKRNALIKSTTGNIFE